MAFESRSNQYGTVFDGWQITKKLGRGSNGKTAVYQLSRKDDDWEETCALKVITLISEKGIYEELSPSCQEEYKNALKQRISDAKQEVRLMEKLRGNTNIVDYLDHRPRTWKNANSFGCDLMIRMELLRDLRSEIASGRVFTESEILKIGRDICNALILCHGKDILHRDIKPENIFFNDDGNYKLGDFGVSRILDACPDATASTGIGTYEYWPAEQMTGRYDKRVDIYSLGLVLYELGNRNRLPFATSTYLTGSEVPMRLAGKPLPAPSEASPALAQVILKACAFNPNERYQSAEAFLKALNWVSHNRRAEASTAVPPVFPQRVTFREDYATELAKELGLPEDIFSDNVYKTFPAQVCDTPQNASFATQPARQARGSYKTAPAEQAGSIEHKKKNHLQTIALCSIALCLIILTGTVAGTILLRNNKEEKEDVFLANGDSGESISAEDSVISETLPNRDETKAASEESAAETTIPVTEPVKMQTIYLRTSYTNEDNDIFYEYNDDGTLYRFANRALGSNTVKYYIYDDGTLMKQIDSLNSATSSQSDRTAMAKELNAILNNPSDPEIQYRILTLDDHGYVTRETFLNNDLSIQIDKYTTYNNEREMIKLNQYYDDNSNTHRNYQYDSDGKLTRVEYIYSGSNSFNNSVTEYVYGAEGKIVERKEIVSRGTSEASASSKTITYWKYTYNAEGLLAEMVEYNEWGTATGAYQKFFYDDAGNIIQDKRKFSANSPETNGSYDYIEIQVPSDQVERLRAIYINTLPVPINIPDEVT